MVLPGTRSRPPEAAVRGDPLGNCRHRHRRHDARDYRGRSSNARCVTVASHESEDGTVSGTERPDCPDDVDPEPGARGAVYALVARAFTDPDDELYEAIASGSLTAEFTTLVDRSGLDVTPPELTVEDDHETVSARFNDLFVVGYSEVIDKTDGTVENYGPPVSLYESDYRPEVSWNDVNLD